MYYAALSWWRTSMGRWEAPNPWEREPPMTHEVWRCFRLCDKFVYTLIVQEMLVCRWKLQGTLVDDVTAARLPAN